MVSCIYLDENDLCEHEKAMKYSDRRCLLVICGKCTCVHQEPVSEQFGDYELFGSLGVNSND